MTVAVPGSVPSLQSKSVSYTPTTSAQSETVTADSGYDGLSSVSVTVNRIPQEYIIPTGTLAITQNGTGIDVTQYAAVDVNVSGGGASDLVDILEGDFSGAFYNSDITKLKTRAFSDNSNMTSVTMPNLVTINQRIFEGCTKCASFNLPSLTTCGSWAFALAGSTTGTDSIILPELTSGWYSGLFEHAVFTAIVLPKASQIKNSDFAGSSALLNAVDLRSATTLGGSYVFNNRSGLTTIILGSSSVPSLGNINVFNNTPFASGGSGGTIYIPESLYNHLGDGTALDYKAAANWSTIDGYGTVTWAKIEGSQYENYYADGTPIT